MISNQFLLSISTITIDVVFVKHCVLYPKGFVCCNKTEHFQSFYLFLLVPLLYFDDIPQRDVL